MKKTAILIVLAMSFMAALAGDVVKVLKIYSGEKMVAIPVDNIDSLNHSMYDADSILHSEYISSIVHTFDQDYKIPIASIDSIVIGEIDMQQFEAQTNEIIDFINEQTELELNTFQTNLLQWLNAKENIQEAAISEDKDYITILFKNGMEFYIDFQDISGFEEDAQNDNRVKPRKMVEDEEEAYFYDVTSQKDERIIENPNVLYIRGLGGLEKSFFYWTERLDVGTLIKYSPINGDIDDSKKSLDFIVKKFANYGLVIITQTHGRKDGSFLVTRNSASIKRCPPSLLIYYKDDILVGKRDEKDEPVYVIKPSLISKKLIGNKETIIYGNYCHSYNMSESVKNNNVIGYDDTMTYNGDYMVTLNLIDKLYNGAILGNISDNKLTIPNSKQRYFSISINSVTKEPTTGNPVIEGKIKGFENFKEKGLKGFEYYVYVWGDDVKFDLADITTNGKKFEIKDGTFNYTYSSPELAALDISKYHVAVAFTYGGKTYYGFHNYRHLCPDDHHPHIIDLGLPSGTKWACCNVNEETSMQRPSNYGSYYAWGETQEKFLYNIYSYENNNINCDIAGSNYDAAHYQWGESWVMPSIGQIGELINNCTSQWTTKDGIYGRIFTGPSGESIFLPAAGINWFLLVSYRDIAGAYWSSTPSSSDKACALSFNSELIYGDNENTGDRYIGLPVRPVWIGE